MQGFAQAVKGTSTVSKTIMYLSYGKGPHVAEAQFSLATAFRLLPARTPGYRYVVYTDDPAPFVDLGVEIRLIEAAELSAWLGPSDYPHRRKIMSIIDALERYGGDVAFVDSDTWFRKSPKRLFSRIGPGKTCFHVWEGKVSQSKQWADNALIKALAASDPILDLSGKPLPMSGESPMWNTGVFGINVADLERFKSVLGVVDQLWEVSKMMHVDQFASGIVMSSNRYRQSIDIVFHYWPWYLKDRFREELPAILDELSRLPPERRPQAAFERRVRATPAQVVKHYGRRAMRAVGLAVTGHIKSA